jgi:hypothetical protein
MAILRKMLMDHPEMWDAVIPHSMIESEVAEDLRALKTKQQRYAYVIVLETAARIAENNAAIAKKALGEIEKPDPLPWKTASSANEV